MSGETDLGKELEDAMGKTNVNWGHVRRVCEEIDRQRKQAGFVAKRLMGNKSTRKRCPACHGDGNWCSYCSGEGEIDGN